MLERDSDCQPDQHGAANPLEPARESRLPSLGVADGDCEDRVPDEVEADDEGCHQQGRGQHGGVTADKLGERATKNTASLGLASEVISPARNGRRGFRAGWMFSAGFSPARRLRRSAPTPIQMSTTAPNTLRAANAISDAATSAEIPATERTAQTNGVVPPMEEWLVASSTLRIRRIVRGRWTLPASGLRYVREPGGARDVALAEGVRGAKTALVRRDAGLRGVVARRRSCAHDRRWRVGRAVRRAARRA